MKHTKEKYVERIFNFRPLCLIFLNLICGSVFAFGFSKNLLVSFLVLIIYLAIILIFTIRNGKLIFLLIPLISLIAGAGLYSLRIGIYTHNQNSATPTIIKGRIYDKDREVNTYQRIYIEDCSFDGKYVNTNVVVTVFDYSNLFENNEIGNYIEFKPNKFDKTDAFYHGTPNETYINENIKFSATCYSKNIVKLSNNKTLAEKIRTKIKDNLSFGLTNENKEFVFSSLFGKKYDLSKSQQDSFILSGIAHLLAVSGLHIGIIVTLLSFVLEKLKIKRWYKFFIIFAFLIFYSYLCDFSASVVRASVMSLVLMMSFLVFKKYDSLSSISFAGIIVFLINPIMAFSLGAVMSFSCALGITLLCKPLKKLLLKIKFPKFLVDILAITISVIIILTMVMAVYFKNLNLISLISNVIILPIFTLVFSISFIIAILSLIIPYIAYTLLPFNYIYDLIYHLSIIFSSFDVFIINTSEVPFIAIYIYLALIFMLSRFNLRENAYKIILSLPLLAILLIFLL